jgi:hypothetical protein
MPSFRNSTSPSSATWRANSWWASNSSPSGPGVCAAVLQLVERQDGGDRTIQVGLGQVAVLYRLDDSRRRQRVARHLQIEAGGDGLGGLVHRPPIGDHHAVPAPLVAQDLGQQQLALGGEGAVDLVVGAHHGLRLALADGDLEAPQVDLAQRPLAHPGIDRHPTVLLVVDREVLEGGADALALDAAHEGAGDPAGEQRVLAVVLEVAPAQRMALHVEPRAEQQGHVLRPRLGADRRPDPLDQLRVPGGGHGRGRREAGRGLAGADRLAGAAPQPDGTIGHPNRRDAEALYIGGLPGVAAGHQRSLLLQGQLRDEIGGGGFRRRRSRNRLRRSNGAREQGDQTGEDGKSWLHEGTPRSSCSLPRSN